MIEKYTQEKIDKELSKNPETTIGDLNPVNKIIEKEAIKDNKEIIRMKEVFEKSLKNICFHYVSLNTLHEIVPNTIKTIKKEMEADGINIEENDIKIIMDLIKEDKGTIEQVKTYKKFIDGLKKEFSLEKEISDNFENILKGNEDLDTFMLYELTVRKTKHDLESVNIITELLEKIMMFNDYKDELQYLEKDDLKVNKNYRVNIHIKENIENRIKKLEIKMKDLFKEKLKDFTDPMGKYQGLFIS